ncbi:MAG: DNA mismatch repair endonuclease MutL [Promethearchaeota archaeon]
MKRSKIQKIRDAEKIAAGEVVERPSNVVKELIENSIDAGAKEIRILTKKAGKQLIQVIDDGEGIAPDEIEIAFERHTSSKIKSIEDLETLSTLGFRGEALASIAAVSQVEIISRTKENEVGIRLIIEGGRIKEKNEIYIPIGTDIKVKNIFYNLPARQKFLKKDTTELGHITDIIQRYALANPNLHFIYRHNDLDILNCPGSNDLKTTVFHIYGKKVAKFMEYVEFREKGFKLYGLIGHSEISSKNRSISSIFINKRYIISDLLYRAVQEAFKGILMIGKFPFFILYLEVDPSVVDFNVHPKKLHIRFEDEETIYNKVYNIIRGFVQEKFIEKEDKYTELKISSYEGEDFVEIEDIEKIKELNFTTEVNQEKEEKEPIFQKVELSNNTIQLNLADHALKEKIDVKPKLETLIRQKFISAEHFPKIRMISYTGQLSNKTYIVLEGINEYDETGIYILDQHAASERINKEYFYELYNKLKINRQRLISPLKIEVSPSVKFFLEANLGEIRKLGFIFEHFGGNTFILREIPTIIEKLPNIDIIKEIISDITNIGKDKSFGDAKEEIINYLSCHKSIRGGDDLSIKDIRKLLVDLSKCKDPYHCAHGRPTLRFISFKELDKFFKRIV